MEHDSNISKISAPVKGMSCAACSSRIQKTITSKPGVISAVIDFATATILIEYDTKLINLETIKKEVEKSGYEIIINKEKLQEEQISESELHELKKLKIKLTASVLLSIPVFVLSMFFMHSFRGQDILMLILSTPVILWSGNIFFINAWKNALKLTSNMDTLVALGTGAAYLFSLFNTIFPSVLPDSGMLPHVYFESAVVVITLVLLGRYIEEKAKNRATSAIKSLNSISPKTINIIRDNHEICISAEDLKIGDIVVVKPGERITADGEVVKGITEVDESMLTGEAAPVLKSTGDKVYAGTINLNGLLLIKALKDTSATLLAGIIREVRHAGLRKAPLQRLADKIASIFVPIMLAVALLTFAIWYFWGPVPSVYYAFATSIPVLIIACPCALGLATPIAIVTGVGRGANMGILIKDVTVLEKAWKVNTIVFDKTGTLTEGKPRVVDCFIQSGTSKESLNAFYTLEKATTHPMSVAIADYLKNQGAEEVNISEITVIPGAGVTAKYRDQKIFAGNKKIFGKELSTVGFEIFDISKKWEREGATVVYIGDSSSCAVAFALNDSLRANSAEAVEILKKMHITPWLLTGDNAQAAERAATACGIVNISAGVLPVEKAEHIKKLRKEGYKVAMVGDGVNDAAALTEADLGIALSSGTDIAMESAGITLFNPDLRHVASAIKLSKATIKIIRQNLFWAFFYNVLAIPIAAGVLFPVNGFLLNPMIAGIAMSLSSLSVVLNSLRLKSTNI